ncbi:hypothetical protein FOL47_010043 [Perkinsus chesapeaki]|uniref:Uncharacterized protein n=1 Tax=Perkinsus chesapeaki TaxID=330153 RepID=A0A7J6L535_PERCH|nr:hypothetical protein FOL47_010043 [Perkinsus chesapeaki]
MTDPEEQQHQPPASVKLFVRGLTVNYPESDLRSVFEKYGLVEDVFILRDRSTQQSRGMAFVRFRDLSAAMSAMKALNGTRLPMSDSHIPLSVSLAQGEAERLGMPGEPSLAGGSDTKLFVSGLGPETQEPELRDIFEPFGRINEIHVPGPHALYAFVRFVDKEDALKAIREISGRVTVEGSQRPLEVKIAESKSARAERSTSHSRSDAVTYDPRTPSTSSGYGGLPNIHAPRGGTTTQAVFRAGMAGVMPGIAGVRLTAGAAASLPINGGGSAASSMVSRVDTPVTANGQSRGPQAPRTAGVWTEYFTMDDTPYYHNSQTNEVQWEMPAEFRNPINVHTAPQTKGPPGANVFVFSVPDAWTEQDLRDHFTSFGTIVSAKVVVDKHTGLSRGYGFISYDNAQSAARAVSEMNGFVAANGRRIKVQIKKGEEGAAMDAPYQRQQQQRQHSSRPY